jgi:solute carrier family 25 S-adenosylmethionine transporter 26
MLTRKQAGAFAGLGINCILYPFDTLKTRIQAPWYNATSGVNGLKQPGFYRGLYRGLSTVVIFSVPASGIFFTTYESGKAILSTTSLPIPVIHGLSSAIAQIITSTVVIPGEVIKQRSQVLGQKHTPKSNSTNTKPRGEISTWTIAKDLIKNNPSRLWRGYTALLLRDLPFTALQFPILEQIKSVLLSRNVSYQGATKLNAEVELLEYVQIATISGAIAGSAAAWLTTPADVIKTRLILGEGDKSPKRQSHTNVFASGSTSHSQRNGGSIVEACYEIWRHDGVKGFFRGGAIRTVWTFVGNGLFIGCYEGAKFMFRS